MGGNLAWYLILAVGAAVAMCGYWLYVRAARGRGTLWRGLSWRRAQYYDRFLATLSAEHKRHFLSLSEGEQFQAYMDWSLKEGLRGRDLPF